MFLRLLVLFLFWVITFEHPYGSLDGVQCKRVMINFQGRLMKYWDVISDGLSGLTSWRNGNILCYGNTLCVIEIRMSFLSVDLFVNMLD